MQTAVHVPEWGACKTRLMGETMPRHILHPAHTKHTHGEDRQSYCNKKTEEAYPNCLQLLESSLWWCLLEVQVDVLRVREAALTHMLHRAHQRFIEFGRKECPLGTCLLQHFDDCFYPLLKDWGLQGGQRFTKNIQSRLLTRIYARRPIYTERGLAIIRS